MYNDLNSSQKRYLEIVKPSISTIITEFETIFSSRKTITRLEFSQIVAPKLGLDPVLFGYGLGILLTEEIITGVSSVKRVGMSRLTTIAQNPDYEFGECPESKRNGKYFKLESSGVPSLSKAEQDKKNKENMIERLSQAQHMVGNQGMANELRDILGGVLSDLKREYQARYPQPIKIEVIRKRPENNAVETAVSATL
jgi:hypothetical protein